MSSEPRIFRPERLAPASEEGERIDPRASGVVPRAAPPRRSAPEPHVAPQRRPHPAAPPPPATSFDFLVAGPARAPRVDVAPLPLEALRRPASLPPPVPAAVLERTRSSEDPTLAAPLRLRKTLR